MKGATSCGVNTHKIMMSKVRGGGNQWPGAPVGARAYVGEFHPKCSKFGTFVHLGSKTSKQNLKEMSFRGPFVQTLEKCEKCNFVIFLYKKFIFT